MIRYPHIALFGGLWLLVTAPLALPQTQPPLTPTPTAADRPQVIGTGPGTFEVHFPTGERVERPFHAFGRVRITPVESDSDKWAVRNAAVDTFYDGQRHVARFHVPAAGTYRIDAQLPDGSTHQFDFESAMPADGLITARSGDTFFTTRDGTPLFWLADTAWNGVLKSDREDWQAYLATRAAQRFTAIQFVTTPWRGAMKTLAQPAFKLDGDRWMGIDVDAMTQFERRVGDINRHHMIAAAVMLWALTDDDPGIRLNEAEAIALARYQKARLGAHRMVWFLGGDGRYKNVERWRRIGRAVFGTDDGWMRQCVTLHPSGLSWVGDQFADEAWMGFHGYQSGHGDGDDHLRRHLTGPWTKPIDPVRPVINLEPNYEAHPAYQSGRPHGADHVRRAAYRSMLIHPPAGVSYGHNAIWVWNNVDGQVAENHRFKVDSWRSGLTSDGIESMTRMRNFFELGDWWNLRPITPETNDSNTQHASPQTDNANTDDAKTDNAKTSIVAAATPGGWTIAYSPTARPIKFVPPTSDASPAAAFWFDPRTGRIAPANADTGGTYHPPGHDAAQDWIWFTGLASATPPMSQPTKTSASHQP